MDPTSSTLLQRLADRNDQEAWRDFDQLYRPLMFGYARKMGLGTADAEDVVQNCSRAVLRRVADFEHVGSFKAWLKTITTRCVLDIARAKKLERADTQLLNQLSDGGARAEALWERQWLDEHLRFCLEKIRRVLSEHNFQAFYRTALREEPPTLVAQELGLSLNQVYVAKHRGFDRIRALMLELSGVDLTRREP